MEQKRFFVNVLIKMPIHGKTAGEKTKIETDKHGIPLLKEWRNRFRDANVGFYAKKGISGDGCIEIIERKENKPPIKKEVGNDKEEKKNKGGKK